MGVVSPLGNNATAAFGAARDGRSGIGPINAPFAKRLVAPIAATAQFDGVAYFEPLKLRMLDRVSQFAVVAARQALADTDIDWARMDRSRVGVFVGTGMGGTLSNDDGYKTLYAEGSDRIKPFTVLAGMHNAPAAWIGLEHGLTGPNLTYSTACSSSAVAIGEAWESAMERGAAIQGELLGYGLTTDAGHITRPSALGQAAAMSAALRSAELDLTAVDAINAHGTGTLANDAVETAAIKAVFGKRAYQMPVSATKALHGHLLGAAGALECVLSLLAMQHQIVLPTLHLRTPDPECDLDYVPNVARSQVPVRTMLSNSFAFGGTNAVLVLRAST
jgi:3-oxoacyl-(acyl-carrier-protein) synthase